jgi:hypothetical protein
MYSNRLIEHQPSYSATASTYDSGVITGITGTYYKILIENNAGGRPAILMMFRLFQEQV